MKKTQAPSEQLSSSSQLLVAVGIGLMSLAMMQAQIVLTRIFSVIVWYHFAFFAISVALLGLGTSALIVHALRDRLNPSRTGFYLALASLLFSGTLFGLELFLLHVTPDWFGMGSAASFTVFTPKLLFVFAATMAPFLSGGFVVSLVLTRWPNSIHRNYGWDLGGAALACAIVVPLLDRVGAPDALISSVAFGAVAAVVFVVAGEPSVNRTLRIVCCVFAGALLIGSGVYAAQSGGLAITTAKGLDLSRSKPEFNRWNSFSLISVFPSWNFRGWGLSPAYTGPVPEQKSLVIDMNALTSLTAFRGDFNEVSFTRHDLSALAFKVHPAPDAACIVGAGGGKDVLAALAAGSRRVTAVEVNPLIANDVMRDRYRAFTGGLYFRPEVDVQVEDARSYMRRTDDRYDVILISMVDTSAATAAGAYALTENSLYTVSAFRDFIRRLKPGGILTVASVSLKGLAIGARLASLARAALSGTARDFSKAVAVAETPWVAVPGATMYNLLIKPSQFSAQETQGLAEVFERMRFGATYLPGRHSAISSQEQGWIERILEDHRESEVARAIESWPLDVSAVDDDRPFFFYQNRLRDAWTALRSSGGSHLFGNGLVVLLKVLVASWVMAVVCIGLPLVLELRNRRVAAKVALQEMGYVSCLGFGYMFIELGFMQRLMPYLGKPTHALTSVLLVLLLSGALGSRTTADLSTRRVQHLFLLLVGYALLLCWAWRSIADASASLGPTAKAIVAAACLAPLGFLMGVPLPSGLSAVRARGSDRVAWLWGVNGATSVLGSVVATLGSMHVGITAVLLAGIVMYAGAACLWRYISPG